jgi:hypothetical protein
VCEVTKNDPRRVPPAGSDREREIWQIAIKLDKIREEWGSPILITSWYRPQAVNRAVGVSYRRNRGISVISDQMRVISSLITVYCLLFTELVRRYCR